MAGVGIVQLFLLVAMVSVIIACKIRKVDIVMEIGPNGHAAALKFRRSLEKDDQSNERCWVAHMALIYSSQIREKKSVGISVQAKNSGWRDSTVQLLRDFRNSVGNNLQPQDSSPVVVLVLSNYDLSVDKLSSAAKDLQELGFKLITIGVGDGWSVEQLKPVSNSKNRILFANDLSELNPNTDLSINKRLIELLDDPNKEGNGMSTPLNKDMSFNPLGPSAIFQEIMMQPQPQLAVPEKKKCQAIVDLGFILDSSGSLQKDYGKEKDFVKLIARAFNIQYGGSHAGVVTFSHDAELSIRLSETTTYDEFEQDVDRIPHMNSITRIDLALEKAKDELFLDLNGGRHGVKKVLVLLTDGGQSVVKSGVKDHIAIAEQLRIEGVELLVIGIGEQADEVDLERLAGPNDNYRKAADFKELASIEFATKMTTKLCETATDDKCRQIVDVCFMIDSSGSIDRQTDWVTIKDFVRRLANVFQFSETGAHGSAVVFSDFIDDKYEFTKVVLQLNNKLSATEFGKSVQGIPYFGYRTRIDLGFKLVEEKVFQPKYGARGKNVKKVIVLITDGKQNPDMFDPIEASRRLYEDGVNIYAIGIGKEIDFDQLKQITRVPHRVFHADSFDTLEKYVFVNNVSNTVCHNTTRPPPDVTDDCCCPKLNKKFKENLGKQLVNVVSQEMDKLCKGNCEKSPGTFDLPFGLPGSPRGSDRRVRRSLDNRHVKPNGVLDLGAFKTLLKFSKAAGCNIFLNALRKYGFTKIIKELKDQGKHVTIFCPIDEAYEKVYQQSNKVIVSDVLKRHIGVKEGGKYFTLQPGNEVIVGKVPNKVSTQANGIDVLFAFQDGAGSEIIILEDILYKKQNTLLDILKGNSNVSIFYEIIAQTNLADVFSQSNVEEICFTKSSCFVVTPTILNQLKDTLSNQYTIIAPTNTMLRQKSKLDIKSIMANQAALAEFIHQFVFVGRLDETEIIIDRSIQKENALLVSLERKGEKSIIKHKGGERYEVKENIAIKEGLLYVVDFL